MIVLKDYQKIISQTQNVLDIRLHLIIMTEQGKKFLCILEMF